MKRLLLIVMIFTVVFMLSSCAAMEEAEDRAYERGFEDGMEAAKDDLYDESAYLDDRYQEGYSDALKQIGDTLSEGINAAGAYDELIGMVQSGLDRDGDFTAEEAQEAINRLYFTLDQLHDYANDIFDGTEDGGITTWDWDEPYPSN